MIPPGLRLQPESEAIFICVKLQWILWQNMKSLMKTVCGLLSWMNWLTAKISGAILRSRISGV